MKASERRPDQRVGVRASSMQLHNKHVRRLYVDEFLACIAVLHHLFLLPPRSVAADAPVWAEHGSIAATADLRSAHILTSNDSKLR